MSFSKAQNPSRVTHAFFVLIALMCISFVYWAYHGELDIVSVADGQVVPTGKIKHIQHLEGGIIRKINISEGDEVIKGQPLIELEQIMSGASLDEMLMRMDALTVDIIRYTALINDLENMIFPNGYEKKHPRLVQDARRLFVAHKNSVQSKVDKLTNIVEQKKQRIKTIASDLENKRQRLPLLEEQLSLSEELLKDNLTTRYKHIEIMRKTKEIEGSIKNDMSALIEANHALAETRANLKEVAYVFKEKTIEKLKQAQQEHNEFSVRLKKFEDSLKRTVIRSPINGVIKKLYLVTKGGVIKPGDTIADIVPSEERLIIEAHLSISDIGYVQKDQSAWLQLPTADARKYNKLPGKIVNISPDTFTSENGRTFYNVLIESEKNYFQSGDQKYKLYPGMVLLAYIHISKRTVLDYIVDPFMNTLSFSMQER
ncbi:HlyD family type I secretion periplasmic adaptor subunit [Desulfobacula phenolica]|uniref:Membrane fusion protein, adhesin transport system n=1 Tax=Desulfobacula phenolica TaxID=90732 RepID=A0A1H2HEK1_9BACT|nr:HlyD family type I secretion periplasmic adaptor subunit [Desulfobacula phenolica]SDU30264.1 membrane fusion protein, adhesin transport system [Desulfobacula phenolica]